MDMTVPVILGLQVGGNIIFFWGFLKLLSLTVFKDNREAKEPDIENEIRRIERELRRL